MELHIDEKDTIHILKQFPKKQHSQVINKLIYIGYDYCQKQNDQKDIQFEQIQQIANKIKESHENFENSFIKQEIEQLRNEIIQLNHKLAQQAYQDSPSRKNQERSLSLPLTFEHVLYNHSKSSFSTTGNTNEKPSSRQAEIQQLSSPVRLNLHKKKPDTVTCKITEVSPDMYKNQEIVRNLDLELIKKNSGGNTSIATIQTIDKCFFVIKIQKKNRKDLMRVPENDGNYESRKEKLKRMRKKNLSYQVSPQHFQAQVQQPVQNHQNNFHSDIYLQQPTYQENSIQIIQPPSTKNSVRAQQNQQIQQNQQNQQYRMKTQQDQSVEDKENCNPNVQQVQRQQHPKAVQFTVEAPVSAKQQRNQQKQMQSPDSKRFLMKSQKNSPSHSNSLKNLKNVQSKIKDHIKLHKNMHNMQGRKSDIWENLEERNEGIDNSENSSLNQRYDSEKQQKYQQMANSEIQQVFFLFLPQKKQQKLHLEFSNLNEKSNSNILDIANGFLNSPLMKHLQSQELPDSQTKPNFTYQSQVFANFPKQVTEFHSDYRGRELGIYQSQEYIPGRNINYSQYSENFEVDDNSSNFSEFDPDNQLRVFFQKNVVDEQRMATQQDQQTFSFQNGKQANLFRNRQFN